MPVSDWLLKFESALAQSDETRLAEMFLSDCHWRDMPALTWDIQMVSGRQEILVALKASAGHARSTGFRIDSRRNRATTGYARGRAGKSAIGNFVVFEPGEECRIANNHFSSIRQILKALQKVKRTNDYERKHALRAASAAHSRRKLAEARAPMFVEIARGAVCLRVARFDARVSKLGRVPIKTQY